MGTLNKVVRNYVYIRDQFYELLKHTSIPVKCIWFLIFVSYLLSFWDESLDVIAATPGYIFPPSFRIWTAFTSFLLERHIWNVFYDIIMVGVCNKVIEPLWNTNEIIRYFIIVNSLVTLISSHFFIILYLLTSNTKYLFSIHIYGLSGYIAGLTVTVKQVMPDLLIVKTPFGKICNRHVPLIIVLISIVFSFLNLCSVSKPVMITFGTYVTWVYLRFYQSHVSGGVGDMSDSFKFSSFFPTAIQPPISVFANTLYGWSVKLKLCKRVSTTEGKFDELVNVSVDSAGAGSSDKERRKQIALKALSERLSKTDQGRVVGTIIQPTNRPQPTSSNQETEPLINPSDESDHFANDA